MIEVSQLRPLCAIFLSFIVLAECADLERPSPAPPGWKTITAGTFFSFSAPDDTTAFSDVGMTFDSFAGMFHNSQFVLNFDYGLHSNDLSGQQNKSGYISEQTEIDGRKALIVTGPGGEMDGCRDYMSGVYLVVERNWWTGRETRFNMIGCARTVQGLEMLHQVFHSLHFLARLVISRASGLPAPGRLEIEMNLVSIHRKVVAVSGGRNGFQVGHPVDSGLS
ncbi:MAG TPA: hypothetical protein VHU23_13410 [Rhizomicrobium sp.]|nr:hypothetical protein [Rhizomicrobium sp.]